MYMPHLYYSSLCSCCESFTIHFVQFPVLFILIFTRSTEIICSCCTHCLLNLKKIWENDFHFISKRFYRDSKGDDDMLLFFYCFEERISRGKKCKHLTDPCHCYNMIIVWEATYFLIVRKSLNLYAYCAILWDNYGNTEIMR